MSGLTSIPAEGKVQRALLAHELANVLQIVEFGIDPYLREAEATQAGADAQKVRGNLERARGLVGLLILDGVVAVARMQDPATLVSFTVGSLRQPADGVALRIEPGLPPVAIATEAFRACFSNLVTNALRACAGRTADVEIHVAASSENAGSEWVDFCVLDRGPGIDPAIADRLLREVIPVPSAQNGVGLLLGAAFARSQGGTLTVGPRNDGQGTCARLRIPSATQSTTLAA